MENHIESAIPSKQGAELPPTSLVVFGATGNLAQTKLLPALYHLVAAARLPSNFKLLLIVRKDISLEQLLSSTEAALVQQDHVFDREILSRLGAMSQLVKMDSTNPADYSHLKNSLDKIDNDSSVVHNRLYYLAIPPDIFRSVIDCMDQAGLNKDNIGSSRILVEKPFGTDLLSAKDLVAFISEHFEEKQIYRIDHYLAKETAQNILVFRTNNPLIDDIWGRQFIDHIQITAAEMIGIEDRSNFYEQMGALRDIVQSHLLQLMSLVMMEIPDHLDSTSIHAEKLALLNSVAPIKPQHIEETSVRGQYEGYREEANSPDSTIETYAALKLEVTNSRWGGVPILLRTGKQLATKVTEINVVFKDRSRRNSPANLLTIRIQPNEGISLKMTAKKPGFEDELQTVQMDFCYHTSFDTTHPDAYERVLVDAIAGDQTLFASSQEVIRCWEILDPLLSSWRQNLVKPESYNKGTWGPDSATNLAAEFGSEWFSGNSHFCAVHPKEE